MRSPGGVPRLRPFTAVPGSWGASQSGPHAVSRVPGNIQRSLGPLERSQGGAPRPRQFRAVPGSRGAVPMRCPASQVFPAAGEVQRTWLRSGAVGGVGQRPQVVLSGPLGDGPRPRRSPGGPLAVGRAPGGREPPRAACARLGPPQLSAGGVQGTWLRCRAVPWRWAAAP